LIDGGRQLGYDWLIEVKEKSEARQLLCFLNVIKKAVWNVFRTAFLSEVV